MKLVITKALDKVKLSFRLKEIYGSYYYSDLIDLIDNLPIVNHFVFIDPERMKFILDDCAEYTYELIEYVDSTSSSTIRGTPKYLKAKQWYASLSKENKEYIEILIKNPEPYLG